MTSEVLSIDTRFTLRPSPTGILSTSLPPLLAGSASSRAVNVGGAQPKGASAEDNSIPNPLAVALPLLGLLLLLGTAAFIFLWRRKQRLRLASTPNTPMHNLEASEFWSSPHPPSPSRPGVHTPPLLNQSTAGSWLAELARPPPEARRASILAFGRDVRSPLDELARSISPDGTPTTPKRHRTGAERERVVLHWPFPPARSVHGSTPSIGSGSAISSTLGSPVKLRNHQHV